MKICRFNDNRLGLVERDVIFDVSTALDMLPPERWPARPGDALIANLDIMREAMLRARTGAQQFAIGDVTLHSPITRASKILAAPANYRKHVEQDTSDPGVDQGVHRRQMLGLERPVDTYGLFLKASSSLVGPHEGVTLDWPGEERRFDHEVEFAVVIGRPARHVRVEDAFDHVAGYGIGLDITVRGSEERSYRKSADSFALFGPWIATPDEIRDPDDTRFWLSINGETRQQSSTAAITVPIGELIAIASAIYTLYPGDIIMTGTPEGVGPLQAGDRIDAGADGVGAFASYVYPAARP
ncbi:MAG: fumarylacetoacetate hydrolase family protein [Sphingobium sp.]